MEIIVKVDSERVLKTLEALGKESQFAYISQNAINDIAKEVQAAERNHFSAALNLRREPWIHRSIKVAQWAKKKTATYQATIIFPYSPVSDMELGAPHDPKKKFLAVPSSSAFKGKIITRANSLHIKNLSFTGNNHRGNQRTFMVFPQGSGKGYILQRAGGKRKASTVKLLYSLIKHSSRPSKLQWESTAQSTHDKHAARIWAEALDKAIKTAKR